jgi:hypothetical protein
MLHTLQLVCNVLIVGLEIQITARTVVVCFLLMRFQLSGRVKT